MRNFDFEVVFIRCLFQRPEQDQLLADDLLELGDRLCHFDLNLRLHDVLLLFQLLIQARSKRCGNTLKKRVKIFFVKFKYTWASLTAHTENEAASLSVQGGGGLVIRTIKDVRINLVRITNQAEWVSFSVHVPITRHQCKANSLRFYRLSNCV